MSFWRRLLGREERAQQLTYDQIANLIDAGGGVRGSSVVNDKTALQVTTVLACVREIANGCATPALHVYRDKEDGRTEIARNIPEYRLLARRPNEWQTSFEWRRMMTLHAALTGAGLSIKVMGDNRRVRELIPVMPGRWDVRKVSRYEVRYRCWDEFGLIGEFSPDQVFVLNGLQWDWVGSLSAVHLAQRAVGLAMVTEQAHTSFHENGLRPSGVYSVEGTLTGEQYERLSERLALRGGAMNSGKPLILDRAAKWLSTGMSGVDAQHLETRRMQVEEICRAYGVFPSIVGHSDKASTYASAEAFFEAHVRQCLTPWHNAWTQRIDEMLLDGSGPLSAAFDTRYLVAGSMKDRAQWARTMAEMGIYTRNELRDEEGKDPLPGLDEPLTPLNMQNGEEPAEEPDTDTEEESKVSRAIGELERKLDAMSLRQQQPPVVVNNHLPEQRHDITVRNEAPPPANINVSPPNVEVRNEVIVPEQKAADVVVNVEAPNVTVEATMPEPVVVLSHPVSSDTEVKREDGEIVGQRTTFNFEK